MHVYVATVTEQSWYQPADDKTTEDPVEGYCCLSKMKLFYF